MRGRDYSLSGPDAERAVADGLVTENWYKTPNERKQMKELVRRADQPALRDTIILFALTIGFAAGAIAQWPSWWSVPFWLAYGVLYGSAMDSCCHEWGQGTAFKTRWMNNFVYQVACFCMIRDPHCWKFGHARHHSDAVMVRSWIPVLLIGLPRLYGCWHFVMCGWLQHGGLAGHVAGRRLNSRTVRMTPGSRFIYWSMNYHVEHHRFPLVPYFRLPDLHRAMAFDVPAPSRSILSAYREMLPAILRQRANPDFNIRRPLRETANTYLDHPKHRAEMA